MNGLIVKEEHANKVRRELRKFKVPYQIRKGSRIFVLRVIREKFVVRGRPVIRDKFDEIDMYHVLLHLKQIGIEAKLVFPV